MPHLAIFGQALDSAYPPVAVPGGEILQDADRDEDDATLQTGLRDAVAIATGARDHGRKRKMSPITQPNSSTTTENENAVKLLVEQEVVIRFLVPTPKGVRRGLVQLSRQMEQHSAVQEQRL
jgi:hypothetical protein